VTARGDEVGRIKEGKGQRMRRFDLEGMERKR